MEIEANIYFSNSPNCLQGDVILTKKGVSALLVCEVVAKTLLPFFNTFDLGH